MRRLTVLLALILSSAPVFINVMPDRLPDDTGNSFGIEIGISTFAF